MSNQKFVFPSRGFPLVANKIAEADYFLSLLKEKQGSSEEFNFILSAFSSAARSITFTLQAVMSHYPGFDEWYKPKQDQLRQNKLARFFVDLRNHLQKVGNVPVAHGGSIVNGEYFSVTEFIPTEELKEVPIGEVFELALIYFKNILVVIKECYRDFAIYTDPRTIFTLQGLKAINWSIEDLEECLGFPRGYTDVDFGEGNNEEIRLTLLSKHGGDELIEVFFEKYKI